MYPVGFLALLTTCMSYDVALKLALALPSAVFFCWLSLLLSWRKRAESPETLPECPLSMIVPFYRRRFDFLRRGFELTGQAVFKFKLIQHTVIVLSGAPARRDFFQSRDLDLSAGFMVLYGAIPMLPGITFDLDGQRQALIYKRLATAQNSERLSCLIPKILDDLWKILAQWNNDGMLDPFEEIPKLTFQSNVRSLAASELAEDPALVAHLKQLYDTLDAATTPASVLAPWFPSPNAVRRLVATKRIYNIVRRAVSARVQSSVRRDDTLQILMDSGDDQLAMLGFIMGLLVAGARSTGTTASWLITFLAGHREWREKAAAELRQLLADYDPPASSPSTFPCTTRPDTHLHTYPPSTYTTSSHASNSPRHLSTLSSALSAIPLVAWESHTPVLDAIIRETLRLAQPHAALRRNTSGAPVHLASVAVTVPAGAFAVYPFADVHLSAELYPDPWRFDPARPECKMPYAYVGWGAGKSVCLGQRLARLQLKLVTALIILGFDIEAVDHTGRMLGVLPRPNWNDTLTCKPARGSCYLRYRLSQPQSPPPDEPAMTSS